MLRIITGVLGLVLAISAIVAEIYYPTMSLLVAALSVSGLVFLVLFSVSYFEAFRTFSRRRSTQLGLNTILMVVFFLFIVVTVNLIVSQYYLRYDLSSTKRFTLSQKTRNVLEGIEDEIRVKAFIGGGQEQRNAISLLEAYRYGNRNLVYSVYDLDAVPALAQSLRVDKYGTVVINHGDRTVKAIGIDENSITNGIIKAVRKESKSLYFVVGHGERAMSDDGRRGISRAVSLLSDMGYVVKPINLASSEEIPGDAASVIVAGPALEYPERELKLLEDYASNGSLIILVDYEGYHMEELISYAEMDLHEGLVHDPENKLAGGEDTVPVVSSYPSSAMTDGFSLTTVYPTVMGLYSRMGSGLGYELVPVVESSESSFVRRSPSQRRDEAEKSVKGSVALAIYAKLRQGEGRIVVFGDSDFITNEYIDMSANGNMFTNVISHLVGEAELVSISPPKVEYVPLYITGSQAEFMTYVLMIALPASIAVLGGVYWLRRRRL